MAEKTILVTADLCRARAKECLYLAQQAASQPHRIMLEHIARHGIESPIAYPPMMHKYSIGQLVYFEGTSGHNAARGQYKIVSLVPIENNNKLIYRIKNPVEAFERTAEEHQLKTALA